MHFKVSFFLLDSVFAYIKCMNSLGLGLKSMADRQTFMIFKS